MSLPYFPMYPTDFEADASHLTLAEDGAYNRLLRLCWITPRCSIPADDDWIQRRLRVSSKEFEQVVKPILGEFFKCVRGRYHSPRLRAEWKKASDTHASRVKAGSKKGSKQRFDNKGKKVEAGCSNQNQNQNHINTPLSPQGGPRRKSGVPENVIKILTGEAS